MNIVITSFPSEVTEKLSFLFRKKKEGNNLLHNIFYTTADDDGFLRFRQVLNKIMCDDSGPEGLNLKKYFDWWIGFHR